MATKENKTVQQSVKKVADTLTKELPELVKENKYTALGALVGYFLSDKLQENEGVVTAVLGGLVGRVADEKKKKDVF